jgi:cadmium resistance protein CadD (predicted permease)
VNAGTIAQAAGLFAVTNFDDIVVLSLFFAQGAGWHGAARRVVAGQYLAFTAILAVSLSEHRGGSQPTDSSVGHGSHPL